MRSAAFRALCLSKPRVLGIVLESASQLTLPTNLTLTLATAANMPTTSAGMAPASFRSNDLSLLANRPRRARGRR